ncbi:probable inactive dual specificity protein phosphatase-like At4g18593 [Lolium perenne]|uniref:probable inactive dual specificity protein phosphatase-like At4g18593 n=1 Tax=Lolium perenne TaxID=4522 RepID=UPI0021F61B04|nr:probable inactive dual specificity protein phosphatase-like At4g18593 [Lolium perenne]XP_051197707.1 probable inactive dual specificity protein phosphatase-like At4g18593 [Lolium perenne]
MEKPESGVEQKSEPDVTEKSVGMGIDLQKLTEEMQGLEVNQKPVLGSVVETGGKHTDVEPRREINQKPVETCQDTAVETKGASPEEKETGNPAGVIYRCKKCRRMVATQEYVVTHKIGSGESRFFRRKTDDKQPECTPAIFVEPMKWMEAVEEGYVSQKLWCMDCKTRLGSFDWAGMQCSCGAWVIPAFQLLRSRIDECQM